ncbi:MAG: hypothetical protein R8P61_20275 [Bacteroidia bacterium]|nr:hypothetical protein [Bacteroidia bacterium]
MKHLIFKNPENLRLRAVAYLLLFVLGLAAAVYVGLNYEEYASPWMILIIPSYLYILFRLIRGVLLRLLRMENHVYKLKIYPENRIVEVWSFGKWFEWTKHSLAFEEITAVVHKTRFDRLNFRFPIIRHNLKTKGVLFVINRHVLRPIFLSFLFLLTFPITLMIQFPIFDSLVEDKYPRDYDYDARPTAVSLVKGKNQASFMMLSSYGWRETDTEKLYTTCQQMGINIFDKRSPFERKDGVFL